MSITVAEARTKYKVKKVEKVWQQINDAIEHGWDMAMFPPNYLNESIAQEIEALGYTVATTASGAVVSWKEV